MACLTPLKISQTAMDDGDPFVHRVEGLQPEVGNPQSGVEIPIGYLTGPTLLILLKALLSLQLQIRT